MFCRKCGAETPDDSQFCRKCGPAVNDAAPATSETAAWVSPLAIPRDQRGLSYNWGKFQGWVSLVVGAFSAIFLLPSLVTGGTLDTTSTNLAIMSPLLVISGYAFVRRKKFAVRMTYLWIVFYVVIFAINLIGTFSNKQLTPEQFGEGMGRSIAGLFVPGLFWVACANYYRKRRSEFR